MINESLGERKMKTPTPVKKSGKLTSKKIEKKAPLVKIV